MNPTQLVIALMERGCVPDGVTRAAIRRLCRARRREVDELKDRNARPERVAFLKSLHTGPIALLPEVANDQHYELPAEFFAAVLGPRRKYSCCYFENERTTLAEAEEAALAITCQRAGISDGRRILELACGWGALSLWMAERYPRSRITAVSNSAAQRQFIEARVRAARLDNLRVVTADMNDFTPGEQKFDHVVSVEMFEHMRNFDALFDRIASWLTPDGTLFVHIFCRRGESYPFETNGAANWMGRHFFTGGIMPSATLFHPFNRALTVTEQHTWNGHHYRRTAEAWLRNLDARRDDVLRIFASVYGAGQASRWLNRWRMFFLAVAELFGFDGGDTWFVGHYLFEHAPQRKSVLTLSP